MLHLGPHAGFELFGLFLQRAPGRVLLRVPSWPPVRAALRETTNRSRA
jgi:hypothetical protein